MDKSVDVLDAILSPIMKIATALFYVVFFTCGWWIALGTVQWLGLL